MPDVRSPYRAPELPSEVQADRRLDVRMDELRRRRRRRARSKRVVRRALALLGLFVVLVTVACAIWLTASDRQWFAIAGFAGVLGALLAITTAIGLKNDSGRGS